MRVAESTGGRFSPVRTCRAQKCAPWFGFVSILRSWDQPKSKDARWDPPRTPLVRGNRIFSQDFHSLWGHTASQQLTHMRYAFMQHLNLLASEKRMLFFELNFYSFQFTGDSFLSCQARTNPVIASQRADPLTFWNMISHSCEIGASSFFWTSHLNSF